MPTPRKGYWIDGKRIPSVTTILSRFKDAGGLIHWAWQCGMDGIDYRDARDAAATAGTVAHHMVEAYIRAKDVAAVVGADLDREVVQKATTAFGAFEKWAANTNLKPTETECSLISKTHRFGGTLDAMLVNDKLSLGDWKTSNSVYADYLLQLAAYGLLWEENYPNLPIDGGFHLLRFDKTHGDFHHHWYGNLDEAKRAFLLMRELYDIDKGLKKRAA